MSDRGRGLASLAILAGLIGGPPEAAGQAKSPGPSKKILVELYTSQGSRSSPPASDLLGRLERLGYRPDKVVALNFHVDDFNAPWVDPYADPLAGRRRAYYGEVFRRRDLASAPLMVIDGRRPLVGPDRSSVLAALATSGRDGAGVALDLGLGGAGVRKTLSVRVAGRSTAVEGRDLLVGVALAEASVTTRVASGENAGRTLVEHQVVRSFVERATTLDRSGPRILSVPLELPAGAEAGRFRATAFVQDRLDGSIYQAESIPWGPVELAHDHDHSNPGRKPSRPRVRRANPFDFVGFAPTLLPTPSDADLSCPDCGTPFSPEYVLMLPPGYTPSTRHRFPEIPPPKC